MNRFFLKFACHYALRNLARNRRRTLLTLSIVILASSVTVVCYRYSTAVMQLWADGAADTGTAHVQVHQKGYWEKQEGVDIDLTLREDSTLAKTLVNDPRVAGSVRRLELEGIISSGEQSVYFVGKGIQPEEENLVSPRLFKTDDIGSWLRPDRIDEVVVGMGLAKTLGLKLGDEVTLITQTVQGSVNGIDAKVVGLVNASIPSFSQRIVYAPMGLFQKLIRMPNRYTELAIRLKDQVDVTGWVREFQSAVEKEHAEIRPWYLIEPVIHNVGKIWNSVVIVIASLLFTSAALTVLNIVYMIVTERMIEIGTLMAIGSQSKHVRLIFALEAVFIGLIGGVMGGTLGNLVVFLMGVYGIPFKNPFGTGTLSINPTMDWPTTVVTVSLAIGVCFAASLAPARRASRVDPVQAFRGQLS